MDRIAVFNETFNMCRTEPLIRDSVRRSISGQRLYIGKLPEGEYVEKYDCKITVSKRRTLEAAYRYRNEKVCIHNFASAYSPGGGVRKGAGAQEECICRCSSLYQCLEKLRSDFYGRHFELERPYYLESVFTPSVKVFREDSEEYRILPKDEWYDVDVASCSAPDLRRKNVSIPELKKAHRFLLESVCRSAAISKDDVLILGAFGCGVFKNDPELVAEIAKEVTEKYRGCFRMIEFAVYCGKDDTNYRAFRDVLT